MDRPVSNKDPYAHLITFVCIYEIMKIYQMDDEFIFVSLFPFSLEVKAEHWYEVIPPNWSWDELYDKFLNIYTFLSQNQLIT